jgi:hypothetical protein
MYLFALIVAPLCNIKSLSAEFDGPVGCSRYCN